MKHTRMILSLGLLAAGCDAEQGLEELELEERACPFCQPIDGWEELDPHFPDPPDIPAPPPIASLTFRNVDLHPASYPEFASVPQAVRRNFLMHTDCEPGSKYLLVVSNGQQGVSGTYNGGNESRSVGLQDSWRDVCPQTDDCVLDPEENGLLRRVVEGNFLPQEHTCRVYIADNGSRWTHGTHARTSTALALAAYLDRIVDPADLEFAYVAAASRGAPIAMGALIELFENTPGDASVPGSGWAAVPTVMTFNDPVFRSDDLHVARSGSMVNNPIVNLHWNAQNDKFYQIDFRTELAAKVVAGNVRVLDVVGGDEVAIAAGARASGSSRFEARQDIEGWDDPIEVFAEECGGASDPYYAQINVRFPLSHSELNGELNVASAGGFVVDPGDIYDTATLEFLADALVDYGIRPAGYAFVDGKGQALLPTSVPQLGTLGNVPGSSPSYLTAIESVSCAPPPPPPPISTCEENCMDDLWACEQYFCISNYDPSMCETGCDFYYDQCMQVCGS